MFIVIIGYHGSSFRPKDFSHALGVPRVSFAPAELMQEMPGTPVGAATPLSTVIAPTNVAFIFDSEVVAMPSYGCNDGTTTEYMTNTYTYSLVRAYFVARRF